MALIEGQLCNDAYQGKPGCENHADDEYTMKFGGEYVYWCKGCGPGSHKIQQALDHALKTRPGFAEQLAAALDEAEAEQKKRAN